MGFTDKQRKWLFVEEALFLMETVSQMKEYTGTTAEKQMRKRPVLYNLRYMLFGNDTDVFPDYRKMKFLCM